EIFDDKDAIELKDVKGKVELRDVTFRYNEDGEDILENINLVINPGENVALVGPSGGGKTTLCNLIPRFYDVNEGKVLVDDIDVVSGAVYENIVYGKPDASKEEVIRAAKLDNVYDFIMDLPQGFDTYVGERGLMLSGGQKQRISIARVFLKNPPILILDEATSALDNKSEKIIQNSLEILAKGRSTLTIAHRLTTVQNADRIIVLTEDGIVEEGSHKELMEKQGFYYNLYKQGGASLETMDLEKLNYNI